MRILIALAVVLLTGLNGLVLAQAENPTLVAVVNRADWCSTCVKNGPRVMSEVVPALEKEGFTVLANDLTNANTTSASKAKLENAGVYNAVADMKKTGYIFLVDAKTKKVVKEMSVAEASDKLKSEAQAAMMAMKKSH